MRIVLRSLLMLTLLAGAVSAQESPKSNPPERPQHEPGPAPRNPAAQGHIFGQIYLGDMAPDFVLDGSRGRPVKLSSLRGDWVVLVFADRREQLALLRTVDAEMRDLGAQVVGVCKEKAYVLEKYAAREKLPFLLLADFSGEVAALYGLFSYARSEIEPGFVVLDRTGTVRTAFVGQQLPADQIARLARYSVTGL